MVVPRREPERWLRAVPPGTEGTMNGYNFTERVRKVLAMAREEAARLVEDRALEGDDDLVAA